MTLNTPLKSSIAVLSSLFLLLSSVNVVFSQSTCPPNFTCHGGCTYAGQCVNNSLCAIGGYGGARYIAPSTRECGSFVVGGVGAPLGLARYNTVAEMQGGGIGALLFFSTLLRLFTAIAGLAVFANFLYAAYVFISKAGDSKAFSEVQERLTFSIIGIVIIVAVYMIAAIIGLIFFGDASFILQPDITQFGALSGE